MVLRGEIPCPLPDVVCTSVVLDSSVGDVRTAARLGGPESASGKRLSCPEVWHHELFQGGTYEIRSF